MRSTLLQSCDSLPFTNEEQERLESKLERILEMAQGGILLHKREEAGIPEESTTEKGVEKMNSS